MSYMGTTMPCACSWSAGIWMSAAVATTAARDSIPAALSHTNVSARRPRALAVSRSDRPRSRASRRRPGPGRLRRESTHTVPSLIGCDQSKNRPRSGSVPGRQIPAAPSLIACSVAENRPGSGRAPLADAHPSIADWVKPNQEQVRPRPRHQTFRSRAGSTWPSPPRLDQPSNTVSPISLREQ